MVIKEQDEIIEMLEQLRDHKRYVSEKSSQANPSHIVTNHQATAIQVFNTYFVV